MGSQSGTGLIARLGTWLRPARIGPPASERQELAPSPTPFQRVPPELRLKLIVRALQLSGVSHAQQCDAEFVIRAAGQYDFFTGLDLRRHGDRLSKDELRRRGINPNAYVTQQFLDILNEEGIKDPVGAGHRIATMIGRQLAWLIEVQPWRPIEPGEVVHAWPSNMAAGPCAAVLDLARHPVPRERAGPFPLPTCEHPDQCGCHYRSFAANSRYGD